MSDIKRNPGALVGESPLPGAGRPGRFRVTFVTFVGPATHLFCVGQPDTFRALACLCLYRLCCEGTMLSVALHTPFSVLLRVITDVSVSSLVAIGLLFSCMHWNGFILHTIGGSHTKVDDKEERV